MPETVSLQVAILDVGKIGIISESSKDLIRALSDFFKGASKISHNFYKAFVFITAPHFSNHATCATLK